ncbi:hypothetical protein PAPYR_3719 [Paratrimastix pyriformis]|uniref:Uncharacterized protein n=1 Tax=Paratrimastix pyriformis TaxID=342808 RepID=A0ABQ8URL8_9EUKA|nr:hypothetical protein PAPYR_3719 [Paratrimastix pyriformis]
MFHVLPCKYTACLGSSSFHCIPRPQITLALRISTWHPTSHHHDSFISDVGVLPVAHRHGCAHRVPSSQCRHSRSTGCAGASEDVCGPSWVVTIKALRNLFIITACCCSVCATIVFSEVWWCSTSYVALLVEEAHRRGKTRSSRSFLEKMTLHPGSI